MRRISMLVAVAACMFCALAPVASAAWQQVGPPVADADWYQGYDLKNVGGRPYVAYVGADHAIRVRRLSEDGQSWQLVGDHVNRSLDQAARHPSLAVSPDGVPWIAWDEPSGSVRQIRAAHLSADGTKWVEPDGRDWEINSYPPGAPEQDRSVYNAVAPNLVFFAGRPYIAYLQDNPSEYKIDVVRLAADGRSWEGITSDDLPAIPRNGPPDLVVIDGVLHMGVGNGFSDSGVAAFRLTDGAWQRLGGGDANNSLLDRGGYPRDGFYDGIAGFHGAAHVLWTAAGDWPTSDAVVSTPDGASWKTAGGASLGQGGAQSIRQIGGRLYAIWADGGASHLSRLADDGSSWVQTGPPLPRDPALLAGVEGTPYVARIAGDGDIGSIVVERLDGAPASVGPDEDGSGPGDDSSIAGNPRLPPHEDPPPIDGPCGPVIDGAATADQLEGTSRADTMRGFGGDDALSARAGGDCVFAGDGDDDVLGGAGSDVLRGGTGADVLDGGADEDRLFGGRGNDRLYGRGDEDLLVGGRGADLLVGGGGWDEFRGGRGDDRIESADGRGEDVRCGDGFDRVRADRFDRPHACEKVTVVP